MQEGVELLDMTPQIPMEQGCKDPEDMAGGCCPWLEKVNYRPGDEQILQMVSFEAQQMQI